jgi:hypothetical protein
VDAYQDYELSGRLYMPLGKGCFAFCGIVDILNRIENLCDTILFPQAYFQYRTYRDRSAKPAHRTGGEVYGPMDEMIFETQTGEKATFVVQVLFRQNSTWQGTIHWTEKNQTQHFRSALEMLKLMDDVLSEQAAKNSNNNWE